MVTGKLTIRAGCLIEAKSLLQAGVLGHSFYQKPGLVLEVLQ